MASFQQAMTSAIPPTRLSGVPHNALKEEIIVRFWRKDRPQILLGEYMPYFQFYQKSCEALYLGIRSEAKALFAETHEHILEIVDVIWSCVDSGQQLRRSELRNNIAGRFCMDIVNDITRYEPLNNSINLALRLWLTVDIREEAYAPAITTIQWGDESTLQEFMKQQFPGPRVFLTGDKAHIILGGDFTAVNLRRIGGINLDWTCSLNEHLSFDREFRRLKVYTLKSCLYDQRDKFVEYPKLLRGSD